MERYNEFSKWINTHLCNDLPDNVVAINFNLYEGPNYEKVGETYHERIGEDAYHVEIVGCDRFDEHDEDQVCDEVFTTREDLFFIARTTEIAEWQQGLSYIAEFVEKYLHDGIYADKLKTYQAVGIGFVEGDIEILYRSK